MTQQNSVAVRNAEGDAWETAMGTSARIRAYSGTVPSNCAASETGSMLAEWALASDWSPNASSGAKTLSSLPLITTGQSVAGTGTVATHYRIYDSAAATCHEQGTVFGALSLNTNALTAANGNVLNFASTTGVVVGMTATGTGITAGAVVLAVTSTTVTLDRTSAAGVASAAAIAFGGDLTVDNPSIASGQSVQITGFTKTWAGA